MIVECSTEVIYGSLDNLLFIVQWLFKRGMLNLVRGMLWVSNLPSNFMINKILLEFLSFYKFSASSNFNFIRYLKVLALYFKVYKWANNIDKGK